MAWFADFVKNMSVISVFLAGIWLLVPRGSMMRSFHFVIGLFTLMTIISSFTSVPIKSEDFDFSKTYSEEYLTKAATLDKTALEYAISELLAKNLIECKKIEIITDISDDESIHITKAVAELADEADFKKAAEMVLNQTGIPLELGG